MGLISYVKHDAKREAAKPKKSKRRRAADPPAALAAAEQVGVARTKKRSLLGGNNADMAPRGRNIHSRQSQRPSATAAIMPTSCAAINAATPAGAMPANVSDSERAIVTAGLANDVEAVNQ